LTGRSPHRERLTTAGQRLIARRIARYTPQSIQPDLPCSARDSRTRTGRVELSSLGFLAARPVYSRLSEGRSSQARTFPAEPGSLQQASSRASPTTTQARASSRTQRPRVRDFSYSVIYFYLRLTYPRLPAEYGSEIGSGAPISDVPGVWTNKQRSSIPGSRASGSAFAIRRLTDSSAGDERRKLSPFWAIGALPRTATDRAQNRALYPR